MRIKGKFLALIKRKKDRIIRAIGVSNKINAPKNKKAALLNEIISTKN